MIKFLVMDVDGTLTDGKIYMGADGEVFKTFDIKDGYALHTLLKEYDIIPVIITARKSTMVEHRCKELGVTEIHQGVMKKLECLKSIIDNYSSAVQQYDLSNVAYIGDDLLDLQCMNPIKNAGGIAGCPSNAVFEVVKVCDFVSSQKGGEGAVREFAEFIIEREGCKKEETGDRLKARIDKAIDYISRLNYANLKVGKYEVTPDFYYTVQEYIPFDEGEAQYESHRQHIDIQWVYDGIERLYMTDVNRLIASDDYDEEKDVIHYYDTNNMSSMILTPNSCVVLLPKDAHKPSRFKDNSSIVKKVVGKLKL